MNGIKKMTMAEFLTREGTLIHATLREEDLGPAFLSALEEIDALAARRWKRENKNVVRRSFRSNDKNAEETSEAVLELMNALSDACPDGCYFGNTEGDGSDFGFWKFTDARDFEERL